MSKSLKSSTLSKSSLSQNKIKTQLPARVRAVPELKPLLARIADLKKSASVVKDGYMDVKSAPPSVDEKYLSAEMDMLRGVARGIIGRDKANAILYVSQQVVNGGTGAAVSSSVPLTVTISSEWASYAALYDEAIVTKMHVKFALWTAVVTAALYEYGVGYDSTRNSNPTSQADVMESTQHLVGAFPVSSGAVTGSVTTQSPDGYRNFHITQKRNPVANSVAVTGGTGVVANFPGEWFETNNAATLAYTTGYLRFYSSPITGNATLFRYNIAFYVSFRERT